MRIDTRNAALLVLCFCVFLAVLSLSAFAADDIPTYLPLSENTYISSYSNSYYFAYPTSSPLYCFAVLTSPTTRFYFVSESSGQPYNINTYNSSTPTGDPSRTLSYTVNSRDSTTGLYYNSNGLSVDNVAIPYYSTKEEGLAAVKSLIENGPPVSASSLQYSLPPGNAIYIQVPQGASYTLKTRMPESVLGSNHYPGNNQAITLVQSLPTGGTAPSSPLIPWQQDGALSVLGLSRNASYQGTNASSGYLCIVNPLYYSGTANGPYEFLSNGSIDITIDQQTGFVVYPLDSTLGFTSGLGINVDTSILDNPFTGGIDPDTGEIIWQDSNGGTTAPTIGGGNLVSTSETIFDFLRNIADEISTFLKGPIQAIQTVVAAIRQFLSSFTQLYMWLPAPVYNLITSALMIALTIGVIKIFV